DGRKYPWGNTPEASCDYAVMDDSNAGGNGCGTDGTMPVGSKPNGVSPYGAYDMIGNVWEWVNDWYASDYYASSPTNDPTGPETGANRVLRGGAWNRYSDINLRASYRNLDPPEYYYLDYRGFRCAMDAE
ncbi:MAG TPA: SUMF1/EgtB/PvdO family nonheme iron enzyme, partial [bacterium]|nr:SUMF1/EgtB/PvdO family nonheme iron enzyme [bacterium]